VTAKRARCDDASTARRATCDDGGIVRAIVVDERDRERAVVALRDERRHGGTDRRRFVARGHDDLDAFRRVHARRGDALSVDLRLPKSPVAEREHDSRRERRAREAERLTHLAYSTRDRRERKRSTCCLRRRPQQRA